MTTTSANESPETRATSAVSRGTLLKGIAIAAGTATVARVQAGVDRAEAAALRGVPAKDMRGSLTFYAGTVYTPSASMVKSANNPIPHHNLQEVIDAYHRLHPGVTITLANPTLNPRDEYAGRTWEVTQLTGDIAPEILATQAFTLNNDLGKGWWLPLDAYLNAPNPYVLAGLPGHDRWIDQFYPGPTAAKIAPDGHTYVIPYDLVTTFFFYNKSIFRKAGVTAAPTTYAAFIDALARIQASGYVPYSGMHWSRQQIGEMVVRNNWAPKIKPTGGRGAYTEKDISLAILHGIFNVDSPQGRDWFRLIKDSVPYWTRDWAASDYMYGSLDQSLKFTQGRLGVLEDGSWRFGLLRANPQLGFEWGAFAMPRVTKGTGRGESAFATGVPAPSIGGATVTQYSVTKTAKEKGTLPLALDFLRYLTAPAQANKVIGEVGQFLPNIKGVDVNRDLAGPLAAVTTGVGQAGMIAFDDKVTTEASVNLFGKILPRYLLGKESLDAVAKDMQAEYARQARETAAKYGWK